jgi:hypothetical protein
VLRNKLSQSGSNEERASTSHRLALFCCLSADPLVPGRLWEHKASGENKSLVVHFVCYHKLSLLPIPFPNCF